MSRKEWLRFVMHMCSAQVECTKLSVFLQGSLLRKQKICIGPWALEGDNTWDRKVQVMLGAVVPKDE